MTSLAFFFGVLPLALTTGAGAGAQNAIGTAVVGGMMSATFIDLFFIPLFYVLVCSLFQRKRLEPLCRDDLVREARAGLSEGLQCLRASKAKPTH